MIRSLLFVLFLSGPAAAGASETIEIKAKGIVCSFCAQGIEKKFRAKPDVEDVAVSLKEKIIRLTVKDGATLSDKEITEAIRDSGYEVVEIRRP